MKIKSVKTGQFAGIKNKEINFCDGLNILVGNNESGKSTMIDLLYQTLFKESKLNKKEDKEFITRYMPSDSKGDVIDGTVTFITAEDEYNLSKEWGASEGCKLVTSDGTRIANEEKIRDIIGGELIYKKGLYDDVVFASQKSQANVVEHILKKLDKKADVKQDLVSTIASEGMSTNGEIGPEDIEKVLQVKIEELCGHWDFTTDGPEKRRGIENPWGKGVGKILETYYKQATLREQLLKCERAEKAIDNDNNKIHEAQNKLKHYQDEKEEYTQYAEALAAYNSNKKLKEEYLEKKKKFSDDINLYPELIKGYTDAQNLRKLMKAKTVIDQFDRIQQEKEKLVESKKALEGKTEISDEDEKKLSMIDKDIDRLQATLTNLNLVANIKKLGNTDIVVKSVATGKVIDITTGEFDINEIVEITVPGIMSMTIAAKGVDAEEVKKLFDEKTGERELLLSKNGVKDLDDLRHQKNVYDEAFRKYEDAKKEYERFAEGVDYNALEKEYICLKEKELELDGLDEKINDLCGSEPIDAFLHKREQRIQSLEEEYGKECPLDQMKKKLEEVENGLSALDSAENSVTSIPEKYRLIEDVVKYKSELKKNIENAMEQIDSAENTLRDHERELGDVSTEDLRSQIDDATIDLQKHKDDYKRWNHILKVLKTTRENMAGDSTMADVQNRFAEYLSVISDGRISLNSMDENMDVDIQSGNNHLNYEILSEGTKDTIALAFRLAMLEHLFPDGGGLVVFDDPFTEMDENRTIQSCRLVQKFADAGNQVIFTTCDTKYKNLLSGNVIEM